MQRLWFEQALLPAGWARRVQVEIAGGVFTSVVADSSPHPGTERHALALPGMGNLHSHAFQRAAAGRTGRPGPGGDSFWTWRMEIYRLAQGLTPQAVGAVAALAYAEMLEAGFTHVGEFHYLNHQPGGAPYDDPSEMAARLLAAAEAVGLDITLLPVFYAHRDLGGAAPKPEQARFVCDLDLYADLLETCRTRATRQPGAAVGVAPHSLRAVTPDELTTLGQLAAGAPFHIHVAEQIAEVERCQAVLGARPVEWLLANQPVDARWCLVHATHVTEAERVVVAGSGAVVGLCPITEADLGDGIFPAAAYAAEGGRWGVGSDSNLFIDLAAELRLLEYGQRLTTQRRNVLATPGRSTGAALFSQALAGGAQALGLASPPAIATGVPATLVTLSADLIQAFDGQGDDLLDAWLFASPRPAIDSVWTRGRRVVEAGRHVDRPQIWADYRQALAELRS